jgi:carbon-monoxide dehydrogenase large subunit
MVMLAGSVGSARPRLEDAGLLTGARRYTGDVTVPDMLHAKFVRSPVAHARISSIDTREAQLLPGVVAVLTGSDFDLGQVYFPAFAPLLPDVVHRFPIASDVVRFVGEIVAVVVAESAAIAVDGTELVVVEYDALDVVVDPATAAKPDAPLLFPELGTNVVLDVPFEAGRLPETPGPVVAASIANQRMAVAPMEPTAITVIPDAATGRITAYASTQMPHGLRDLLAQFVGMDRSDLRIVAPAVGGGFGGKTPAESDYVLVVAVARQLGRPVQWVQARAENLITMTARAHQFEVKLAANSGGQLTSVQVDALTDVGAYPGIGAAMTMTTRSLATGAYDIPHVSFRIRGVMTNTAPVGSFRGAGRPEAIALLERSVDMLAAEMGIDPAEFRQRNLLGADRFPYSTVTGTVYDTGEYQRCLAKALDLAGYDELRRQQAERRASDECRYLGIGISFYVEVSAGMAAFGDEYASVEVDEQGDAQVTVGTFSHGQGHETIFAQIVADSLGLDVDRVRVIDGDTDVVPRGMGTGGSRSAQVGGSAVKMAADEVLEQGRRLAAELLEASTEDIEVRAGEGLAVRGVPASTVSWGELARAVRDPQRRPPDMAPRLFADPGFTQAGGTAPFGCHIAVVEVDGETGRVTPVRMVAVDDCGTVLNPLLAEGQVHGGLAAGIGQALFEEIRYDEHGNPLTSTFADYAMPSAAELPSFETAHTVTPTPKNPLGAKGLGEAGTTGSIAAVHNAVIDAVAHLGIRHIDLPLTPMRVWSALCAVR